MPKHSKPINFHFFNVTLALTCLLIANSFAVDADDQQPASETLSSSLEQAAFSNHAPEAPIGGSELQLNASQSVSAEQTRKRRGRGYSSQSSFTNQPSAANLDSYADAYAAANAPSSGEHHQDLVQSTVQASDLGNYASFGEAIPSNHAGASASTLRHLSNSVHSPQSSYYAKYLTPISSASSYEDYSTSPSYHPHYPQYRSKSHRHSSDYSGINYDRQVSPSYYESSYLSGPSMSSIWPTSSGPESHLHSGTGGLMSSASSALSSWTSGFSVGEIICSLVAIAIGAIILGAPFFLIYLALMGNFSGSGTLSLTNPTGGALPAGGATTTVNGRRKRLAIFEQLANSAGLRRDSFDLASVADMMVNKLSPFIDIQQVSNTFTRLVSSIEKYSNMKAEVPKKKSK